jgi:phage anti-repressor protein
MKLQQSNGLIPLDTNEQGTQCVSARTLYEFLEVKTAFTHWCNRMFEYGFTEDQDYSVIVSVKNDINPQGGRPQTDYALTLDAAKEISMLQRTDKGKQARQYFLECERELKKNSPKTYKEALLELIRKEEEKEALLLENNNLNTVLDNLTDWVSIIKVCQHNKIKENTINWRVLKAQSEVLGYAIKKAESPRYGFQNLYHIDCFRACYASLDYNFKSHNTFIQ